MTMLPAAIFRHVNYSQSTFDYDIALVRLQQKANLSQFVRTICLPDRELANPGELGIVAGWGGTKRQRIGQRDPKAISDILRYAAIPVRNDRLCAVSTKFHFNQRVTFCAGDSLGLKDSCHGDSGGPFMRLDTRNGARKWTASGIVSWGEGCANQNKYGYYTRMVSVVDWIHRTMSQGNRGERVVLLS